MSNQSDDSDDDSGNNDSDRRIDPLRAILLMSMMRDLTEFKESRKGETKRDDGETKPSTNKLDKYVKKVEDQFTKDFQQPDLSKDYLVVNDWSSKGLHLVHKLILLSKNNPQLIDFMKNEFFETNANLLTLDRKQSPLTLACSNLDTCSNYETIERLINAKANPNTCNYFNESPLILLIKTCSGATFNNDNRRKAIKLLIDNGANVNYAHSGNMRTVLHHMLTSNYIDEEIFKILLDANADINKLNSDGYNALMLAFRTRNSIDEKILKMCIDAKININVRTPEGNNILQLALMYARISYNMVKLLIDANININNRNKYGETPIMACCHYYINNGNVDISMIKLLIQAKADLDVMDEDCLTVMDNMCKNRDKMSLDVVKILIEEKANVNAVSPTGKTPLFYVSTANKLDLLISAKADIDTVDDKGATCFDNMNRDIMINYIKMMHKNFERFTSTKELIKDGLNPLKSLIMEYSAKQ
jgi:ankyrin repeat protein